MILLMGDGLVSSAALGSRYCRGCGYDLRASCERCPECGRGFDAGDPRSFYARPRSHAVWRWARRGLLLVLAVVGPAGLGLLWLWWGWHVDQWHVTALREEQAAAYAKDIAATINQRFFAIDEDTDAARAAAIQRSQQRFRRELAGAIRGEPQYPWLRRRLPASLRFLTERTTSVRLMPPDSRPLTDSQLEHIGALRHLRVLDVWSGKSSAATERGLRNIGELGGLRVLMLEGPSLDNVDTRSLSGLTQLQVLALDGPAITDAKMAHLAGLTQLQDLSLHGTAITDAGLKHVAGMTGLQRLQLGKTEISGEGLVHLSGLSRLTLLNLGGSAITDEGLGKLPALPALQYLDISGTKVTDDGLKQLHGRQSLRTLRIQKLEISAKGINPLRAALGKTEITW